MKSLLSAAVATSLQRVYLLTQRTPPPRQIVALI